DIVRPTKKRAVRAKIGEAEARPIRRNEAQAKLAAEIVVEDEVQARARLAMTADHGDTAGIAAVDVTEPPSIAQPNTLVGDRPEEQGRHGAPPLCCMWIIGIELKRLLVSGFRLGVAPEPPEHIALVDPCPDIRGCEDERLVECLQSRFIAA